ncbi:MAG: guanine deaminase, partial [Acidobacteriota bacterium]|nr:guanine deaminase [Acidobacteriota bacterium]
MKIFRSAIYHSPERDRLISFEDGGLAVENGRIAACGGYAEVHAAHPEAEAIDMRDGCILPGLIDTHTHFPQARILGGLGYSLLDWLERIALPEEARMADMPYAHAVADEFTEALAAQGTTAALVFGAHFADATAALFESAARKGLRIVSGLVLSDRYLRSDLLQTPDRAYCESRRLIETIRPHRRLGYAVIPRFALSASEEMLDVCRALLRENPEALFTTHLNENADEVREVARQFPESADYLEVYERSELISHRSVLAHNVQVTDDQLSRLARYGAAVAHCPCSNAALGSGMFPMERHLRHRVRFALGTDVGAGAGFSILREAMHAHLFQRVAPDPGIIDPSEMLYLATKAGAEALNISHRIGDFTPGKDADFVWGKHTQLT